MHKVVSLTLDPASADDISLVRRAVARKLGIAADDLSSVVIARKSLDARRREIKVSLSVDAYIGEEAPPFEGIHYPDVSHSPQAVVVGAGPAGLFAALTLIEHGVRPIVLERGRDVHQRMKDTALLCREGRLDPESNYAFGEGGAGAFSDGKLYTRSSKRGDVPRILRILVQHGADLSILYESHPHIGSDRLPGIIGNIRKTIISSGGEVRFSAKVTGLLRRGKRTIGAVLASGEEVLGPVILAAGHSAKDVFSFLHNSGYALEAKSVAAGVRLELPQSLVDSIQYHSASRPAHLPPASYSFTAQIGGRGVYSFCMCPGGRVVPAATEEGMLSVNGMSPSSRGGRLCNSGIVTEIRKEEIAGSDPFRVLRYIEGIERAAFRPGFLAPAERMTDFDRDRPSGMLPRSTYMPGLIASRLDDVLPGIIVSSLREGIRAFSMKTGGRLMSEEGLLIAAETRTSSPVRILRDAGMKQGEGLYPAGEGAGYAGGIVSAAIDGSEAAMRLAGEMDG